MLNIFHSGLLFPAITGVAILLFSIFAFQAVRSHKKDGTSYVKSPFTYAAITIIVFYIIALLVIAKDYKGV